MKKVLTNFLAVSGVALLMLSSCTKSDKLVTTNGGTPGALTASQTTLVLDRTKVGDTTKSIMFNFTAPKYNYSAVVTNTLQIDAAGDNWKNPTSVTFPNKVYSQGYSVKDFNNLILKLNLPADVASQVNVRVQYALSPSVATYTNVLSLSVTPFNLASWVYVPGIFNGWQNPGPLEDSLESATGNGVYTGIINFTNSKSATDNEFLIVPVKGSWTHKYATNDANGTTSATVTYDGPNNFYAPALGYYMVTLDLNKNTISFQAVDYYSVTGNEVVGGDWGVDQFMKYVNDGSNLWTATLNMAPVSGGGFKIRYDAQWTYSWGIPQAASVAGGQTGVLASDKDDNLSVTTAGTYTTTITAAPTPYGATPLVVLPYTYNGK